MTIRPQEHEYAAFYAGYVNRVPDDADIIALLSSQPDELTALLADVTDEAASIRPAPTEWSIKEVIGHVADTERVFAYRALCIARGDTTPLPGFDQDEYVAGTDFNTRTLAGLLNEFTLQRRANVVLVASLTEDETARMGTASGNPISARALIYCMAGHVMHHIVSLKESYKVGAAS